MRGIYEVRAALEALAGKLFVERATEAHRERLAKEFAALTVAHHKAIPAGMLEKTVGFYDAIFAGAQNDTIAATLRPLSGRIYLLRARSMSVKGRRIVSFGEMKAIFSTLNGNDPAKAWEACWQHVMMAAEYALRTFEVAPGADAVTPLKRASGRTD
ncbi:GntR family transcriptional regulator [Methylocapsa sp. S129]|uniref:GntR family transcriptional regulator n=1 Tax=Methylocapsa sp. S129 TaxID=1641869 RepID=UPI001FEF5A3F|nr:FCD domain-containing protein [Methylocapsa sp. S129]